MTTRRLGGGQWRVGAVLATLALIGFGAASPARAQFGFFGSREVSPEDVSEVIAQHGFRLIGPLYRNGRVYLADVIDRRQRRERLVILAENGQIMQRFFVDVGPERRAAPRSAPRDDSYFSHLTRGWDDEPPPRPPLGLTGPDDVPQPAPPAAPRPKPQPKVVTRTEPTSVTSSPLPPASAAPAVTPDSTAAAKPEVVAVPSSTPGAGAPTPSSVRATSVSTDPLRIPGTRKVDDAKPSSVAVKAPDAPPPAKPKPAAVSDVPVAPLD